MLCPFKDFLSKTFILHGKYKGTTCRSLKEQLKLMLIPTAFLKNGCFIFDGEKGLDRSMVSSVRYLIILMKQLYLQVIEKALEVGADSSRFPNNWLFHSREKKPGKAFVDGLLDTLRYFSYTPSVS